MNKCVILIKTRIIRITYLWMIIRCEYARWLWIDDSFFFLFKWMNFRCYRRKHQAILCASKQIILIHAYGFHITHFLPFQQKANQHGFFFLLINSLLAFVRSYLNYLMECNFNGGEVQGPFGIENQHSRIKRAIFGLFE